MGFWHLAAMSENLELGEGATPPFPRICLPRLPAPCSFPDIVPKMAQDGSRCLELLIVPGHVIGCVRGQPGSLLPHLQAYRKLFGRPRLPRGIWPIER